MYSRANQPAYGRASQRKPIIAALILLTAAVLGYLAGRGHSTAAPVESAREVSNAGTTLSYASASGWQPTSGAPALPGLTIAQPLVLAPGGDGARAGLIVGQLLGSESSPLPPQLLAHLSQLPSTAVVDLSNTQAYQYSRLSDTGSTSTLTLYTIPNSPTSTTAIVCYASAGFSSYMQACEKLAATLTISTGSPQAEVRTENRLTPEVAYGRQISAAVTRVNALLLTLRPEIYRGASRPAVSTLARRLSDGLASAAESVSAASPPAAAERVHAALSESLGQARAAYAALGDAVDAGNASAYAAARTQIYAAEAALSTALKDLALLGYQ